MLNALSLAQLNVAYNRAVVEHKLPLKEIKGFHDKPTGVARLTKVMADYGLELNGYFLVLPKAAPVDEDTADHTYMPEPDGAGLEGLADSLSGNVVKFKAVPTKKAAKGVAKGAAGLVAQFKTAMKNAKPDTKTVGEKLDKFVKQPGVKALAKKMGNALRKGPQATFADHQVITVVVANPKKPKSAAFRRYALYRDGMTVREALLAGLWRADFKWDVRHGHITIV